MALEPLSNEEFLKISKTKKDNENTLHGHIKVENDLVIINFQESEYKSISFPKREFLEFMQNLYTS